MQTGEENPPPTLGPGAAIGAFLEQSVKRLPASAYAGLSGVVTFLLLLRNIPSGLPVALRLILQTVFVLSAAACCWPIIRGVFRNA